MALGGKQAKLLKTQFAKILTRYFAGDSTMVPELEANAANAAPTMSLPLRLLVPSACVTLTTNSYSW